MYNPQRLAQIVRRVLAISPWTVGSVVVFVISVSWAICNAQYRAIEYLRHMSHYSGHVQGTVASYDTSSSLTISNIYSGNSSSPKHTNTSLSQSTVIQVKYEVDGKEFELSHLCSGLIPNVGDAVTVYFRPELPQSGWLIENVRDGARHAMNYRYTSPDAIFLTGTLLSAGLWLCGYWIKKSSGTKA